MISGSSDNLAAATSYYSGQFDVTERFTSRLYSFDRNMTSLVSGTLKLNSCVHSVSEDTRSSLLVLVVVVIILEVLMYGRYFSLKYMYFRLKRGRTTVMEQCSPSDQRCSVNKKKTDWTEVRSRYFSAFLVVRRFDYHQQYC